MNAGLPMKVCKPWFLRKPIIRSPNADRAGGRAGASFRGNSALGLSYVEKLQRGQFVSNGRFTTIYANSGFGALAGEFSGYFVGRGIGFVGFAFDGGAGKQYGWARVFMSGYQRGNGVKILAGRDRRAGGIWDRRWGWR